MVFCSSSGMLRAFFPTATRRARHNRQTFSSPRIAGKFLIT
ncbi:hypothetical protein DDI_3532 [Dickeya dianthicola RNS04.9]|nr:hypothetical protein DDI_3532 [Dickeya dianthicola RNS04.9]